MRSARRAAAAIQLLTLTVDVYGGWERKAEKAEAEWLEGAFPVGARISARTGSSPGCSLWQLVTIMKVAVCRRFQLFAACCSSFSRTLNPKVEGSNPSRPTAA